MLHIQGVKLSANWSSHSLEHPCLRSLCSWKGGSAEFKVPIQSTGAAASAPGRDLVAGEWVRPLPFQHHMSARPTPLEASSSHGGVAARSRQ